MIIWDKQDEPMEEAKQAMDDFVDALHQEAMEDEKNEDLPLSESFGLGK